jgi:hypothetical protein
MSRLRAALLYLFARFGVAEYRGKPNVVRASSEYPTMRPFVMPDFDPEQTKKLHKALREQKPRAIQSLLQQRNGSLVYVDDHAFNLARHHMPTKVDKLVKHMLVHFYNFHGKR